MFKKNIHYLKTGTSGTTVKRRKREEKVRESQLYESIARGNALIDQEQQALRLLERS